MAGSSAPTYSVLTNWYWDDKNAGLVLIGELDGRTKDVPQYLISHSEDFEGFQLVYTKHDGPVYQLNTKDRLRKNNDQELG